jgi:ATP-dependent phosphoenolpyruvate carboxykinase
MIRAAFSGALDKAGYDADPVFGVMVPRSCPDVPNEVLRPRDTWPDKAAYDAQAQGPSSGDISQRDRRPPKRKKTCGGSRAIASPSIR